MTHSHTIEIKLINWSSFNLSDKIQNQFFTKVSSTPEKYCFNNNLPNIGLTHYHEYKMLVFDQGEFKELDFVYFIPVDPDRIKIFEAKGKIYAEFIMFDAKTRNTEALSLLHIPRVTCHPKSTAIFNDERKLFHYYYKEINRILIPFNGFYDGNLPKFNSRLKQHEFFGFYYSCDLPEFNTISLLLERDPEAEFECDFIDDPKLNGYGGYWYHERINFLQFY